MNDFLAELIELPGVSGYEELISKKLADEFKKYCQAVQIDHFYNVYGIMKGSEAPYRVPKIMLAAHMDEIGLIVNDIDDRGFIRFSPIGGVDQRILPAQEVTVHGKEKLFGVIATVPPHIQDEEEKNKVVKMADLSIDVGLPADQVKELVNIGDFITFNSPLKNMQGSFINGKSLDDRAGVLLLREVMKELCRYVFHAEVYFTATVQEEVGTRGAVISTFRTMPDIGIAIDVTHGDTPDASSDDTYAMDKGPVLQFGPNMHPGLTKKFRSIAEENGISLQTGITARPTGTDARSMQISRHGVPTVLIELPLRYMHTTVETLNMDNVIKGAKAIASFISSLKEDWQEWLNY